MGFCFFRRLSPDKANYCTVGLCIPPQEALKNVLRDGPVSARHAEEPAEAKRKWASRSSAEAGPPQHDVF